MTETLTAPKHETVAAIVSVPVGASEDSAFWFELIDEKEAAAFYDLTVRTLQKWRQTGGGPPFVSFSSRCVRYTRHGMREHAQERLRRSTSDPGPAADAA